MKGFERPNAPRAEVSPAENAGTKAYTIESGESVNVSWQEFSPPAEQAASPETNEKAPQPTVVFMPGWSLAANSSSIHELATSFAERTGNPSISVSSSSEERSGKDYLYNEAKGIAAFIKERKLERIVLAGHSQGGDKAVNIAELLQSDPDLHVEGIILMDAVGLYEQQPGELTRQFAKDSLVRTPQNFVNAPRIIGPSMKISTEILYKMLKDLAIQRTGYPEIIKNEVNGMAAANPRLSELEVPIVIISGVDDPISDPEKIMPQEAEDAMREENKDTVEFHDPREDFLKENVFPHSPYIRMVKPTKLSNHGLPLFRSESVANASLYLLERYKRRAAKQPSDVE